jgi:long-chain acyl-CoA synthetase
MGSSPSPSPPPSPPSLRGTIPARFLARVAATPDAVCGYATEQSEAGLARVVPLEERRALPAPPGWIAGTFGQMEREVAGLAAALAALGVGPGVAVALVAETAPVWAAVDLAVLSLGGVTVGIYPTLLPDQVGFQVRHSEARVLLVDTVARWERVAPALGEAPALLHRRVLHGAAPGAPQLVPGTPDLAALRAAAAAVPLDAPCTIVYTSGTTGEPKGAVLTHRNFDAVIAASQQSNPTRPGDHSVVFLPLAHSLQRFVLYRGLGEDAVGWWSPSIEALPEVLRVARPHLLVTVPRMLEKVRAQAEATAAARGPRARAVLDRAVASGLRARALEREGAPLPLSLRLEQALYRRLVYRRVQEKLGGRLRLLVSGGAALSADLALWFEALGIQVREGWGLTETSAPATLNTEAAVRFGTVGRPLAGTELRLDADGEVLVRGPGVFSGYWRDPEATAAVLDAEGWFRTGDLGELDAEGFLRIVDRKKELLVTAGGKNVAPVPIEQRLEGGAVETAVVLGSERPYLVALLALAPGRTPADAREEVEARVQAVNAGLARFEQVKRWAFLPGPLSVEAGELTPTLKLKRRAILARHAALIDGLYAGA